MHRPIRLLYMLTAIIALGIAVWLPDSTDVSAMSVDSSLQDQLTLSPGEEKLVSGAADRIDRYRKGEGTVLVVDAAGTPLSDAAVRVEMLGHDFLFGCNLFTLGRCGGAALDAAYADAFANLFNYATLPFYWEHYEPSPGFDYSDGLTDMALWARDHGITTKGHPLIWALWSVPDWAPEDSDELEKALQARVTNIVKEFCGLIDLWDVVNEPVVAAQQDTSVGRLMKARTAAAMTTTALGWARAACPDATLLVNDFRTDDAFHKILQDVQSQGGEFDAIGIQSHTHMGR